MLSSDSVVVTDTLDSKEASENAICICLRVVLQMDGGTNNWRCFSSDNQQGRGEN